MNSETVMRVARFPLALVLGLLITSAMFTTLRNVTNVVFDTKTIKATPINFTRLKTDTDTASRREEQRPVRDVVPQEPTMVPQMASESSKTVPNVISMAPMIDMKSALKAAGSAMGIEKGITAMVRYPPSYPRTAKVAKIEGYVTMEVVVNPDGTVADIRVVDAAPPRLFDMAAVDAMKRWKFQPKLVNGAPVSQRAQQTIEFRLSEEGG